MYFDPNGKLSANFKLKEFLKSDVAGANNIDNRLSDPWVLVNLTALCHKILQPVADHYKQSVLITSGWRSPALNQIIGGAENSQHMGGEAADFRVKDESVIQVATWMRCSELPFDQLIYETREKDGNVIEWIHVSHRRDGTNRNEVLTIAKRDGVGKTKSGIHHPDSLFGE